MSNVVKLEPVEVGDAYRFDPDTLLEAAKGQAFVTMTVIGQLDDGTFWVSGNANAGETLVLIERAKHQIVFGEDD